MLSAKPSKYRAKPETIDGYRFPSKKEAARYSDLARLQRAGEIRGLKLQVPIMLEGKNGPLVSRSGRQMRLTVDFAYEDKAKGWLMIYEDCKGVPTRDYEVRKAVAQAMGYRITET